MRLCTATRISGGNAFQRGQVRAVSVRSSLLGTPNEGTIISLRNMIKGTDIIGLEVNLPYIQNLSKFDVFTIPAALSCCRLRERSEL